MPGTGMLLPGAAGLVVTFHDQGWAFTLRRADLRPADILVSYHCKEMGPKTVSRFLPNWQSLSWTQVPSGLLSRIEMSAIDGAYAISISADSTGRMQRDELVKAFLRFMKD